MSTWPSEPLFKEVCAWHSRFSKLYPQAAGSKLTENASALAMGCQVGMQLL